jgi:hypothetical protein
MHIETNEKEPAYECLTMKQTTERTPIHTQMSIVITVFTVFRLLTDFVCLYTYEF